MQPCFIGMYVVEKYDDVICKLLRVADFSGFDDDAEAIENFLNHASRHGVLPLLHYLLSEGDHWQACPQALQTALSSTRKQAVAMSMMRRLSLASLFTTLAKANIKPLLLKGEALAHTRYASPELRVRGDTDILIPVTAISRTISALESDGFKILSEHSRYKSHQFTAIKPMIGNVMFQVDVHWRISNAPAYARMFDYETCFAESESIDVNGQVCHVLNPVHALMHACLHLGVQPEEQPERLIWIYDIHLLVAKMSKQELLEMATLASQKGVNHFCLQAIERAQQCIETPVPPAILTSLQRVTEAHGLKARFDKSYLALILADLFELKGPKEKLGLISELLFPGADWLLNKYNKSSIAWTPVLYIRYLGSGLFKRLLLK